MCVSQQQRAWSACLTVCAVRCYPAPPGEKKVREYCRTLHSKRVGYSKGKTVVAGPSMPALNTKGYSSIYLAMGFANIRAGTSYPPKH